MINASDYKTTKELYDAMNNEYKNKVFEAFRTHHVALKHDFNWCNMIITELTSDIVDLHKERLYYHLDKLEACLLDMIEHIHSMKSIVRLIPGED